jgi:hypothetical protein
MGRRHGLWASTTSSASGGASCPNPSRTSWRSEGDPMQTSSTVMEFGDERPHVRQCGRCRQSFPGDPTLHPVALPEWWLCPPCREALLGQAGPSS